jgi:hypothetical protein
MNYAQKFFGHLKTVAKHKYWVWYYMSKCGFKHGWRGLWHDMSKFSPIEFFESVKYYSGTRSPIDACKEENGISMAWMHHKGRNPHHYEYWQDNFDKGGEPKEMPIKYKVEMICDYLGAARAYMGKNFSYKAEYEWWQKKLELPRAQHQNDKDFVSLVLFWMKHFEEMSESTDYATTLLQATIEVVLEKFDEMKLEIFPNL